jgi:hypothetical protein
MARYLTYSALALLVALYCGPLIEPHWSAAASGFAGSTLTIRGQFEDTVHGQLRWTARVNRSLGILSGTVTLDDRPDLGLISLDGSVSGRSVDVDLSTEDEPIGHFSGDLTSGRLRGIFARHARNDSLVIDVPLPSESN